MTASTKKTKEEPEDTSMRRGSSGELKKALRVARRASRKVVRLRKASEAAEAGGEVRRAESKKASGGTSLCAPPCSLSAGT